MIVNPLPADLRLMVCPQDDSAAVIQSRIAANEPACCVLQALAYARGRSFCSPSELDGGRLQAILATSNLTVLIVRLNDWGGRALYLSPDLWARATEALLSLVPILDRLLDARVRAQAQHDNCDAKLRWAIDPIRSISQELHSYRVDASPCNPALCNTGAEGEAARQEFFDRWTTSVEMTKAICLRMAETIEAAYPPPQ